MMLAVALLTLVVLPSTTLPAYLQSNRIVNGYSVDISDVPYQASLRRKVSAGWSHTCGAAVVSDAAVVTAAHCVDSFVSLPNNLRVAVGTTYKSNGGSTYNVAAVHVHVNYSTVTLEHDIALVVTSKKITLSSTVQPIQLAEYGLTLAAGTQALVSGFGATSFTGTSSQTLQAAAVAVVSQYSCSDAYSGIAVITPGMICASADNPPRDACQGDSGGPLVVNNKLIGIVSWGEGCANVSFPGVYTRVSQYNPWIKEQLLLT